MTLLNPLAPPPTVLTKGDPGPTGPAGGIVSAVQSGRWSFPTAFGTVTTLALPSASRGFALPFVPAQSGTITALGCEVTTAAAGCLARLGIYDAGSDAYPTTLLYGSEQIDIGAAVGFKQTAAFSQAVTGGHLYWLVLVAQGTALSTIRGLNSFGSLLTADTANVTAAASWRFTATDVLAATFQASKIVDGSAPMIRALFA